MSAQPARPSRDAAPTSADSAWLGSDEAWRRDSRRHRWVTAVALLALAGAVMLAGRWGPVLLSAWLGVR